MQKQRATASKENSLDKRLLQPCVNSCNALFITRNEQESGSSPLVGSSFYLQIPQKRRISDIRCGVFDSGTSAVGFDPKARQCRRRRALLSRVSSASEAATTRFRDPLHERRSLSAAPARIPSLCKRHRPPFPRDHRPG